MGLVDYGSDSDSDASSPPTPVPSATAKPTSSSSTSLLDLPAPKSSLNLPAPAATTSKNGSLSSKPSLPLPKKKEKGPVRIMLDLPAAQPDGHDEPAKKKPKLTLGSRTGLTGLAAMLPTPKNEVAPVPPVSKAVSTKPAPEGGAGLGDMFGTGQGDGTTQATDKVSMFAPPSVRGKGKAKATLPPPAVEEPAVDFFGIGSVTASSSSLSSAASSKPTVSSAPTISSAPSLRERSASTPKQPSADDPYPGFTQLPSGEWVAKDQKTYEMALEWQQQQLRQQEREAQPKGFDDKEIANTGGYKDVDEAQRAKEAWATRPSQLLGKEEEFKKSTQIKGIPKQASQQARRKGQLSSLIAEAHDNRAELEERIAQARSNRKSAGNKYGF